LLEVIHIFKLKETMEDELQKDAQSKEVVRDSSLVLERRLSRGNSLGSVMEYAGSPVSSPTAQKAMTRSRSSKDSFDAATSQLDTVVEEAYPSNKSHQSAVKSTDDNSNKNDYVFATTADSIYTTTLNDTENTKTDTNPQLPEGWSAYFDDTYQTYYYVNNLDGKTQWEYPQQPASFSQSPKLSLTNNSTPNSHQKSTSTSSLKSRSQSYDEYMLEEGIVPIKFAGLTTSKSSIQWIGSEDHYDFELPDDSGLRPDAMERRRSSSSVGTLHNEDSSSVKNLDLLAPSPQERFEEKVFPKKRETSPANSTTTATTASSSIPGGKNQDYLALARLYKIQRPYADPHYLTMCLLCHKNVVEDVFFPCEHHCVCRKCLKKEKICSESDLRKIPDGYINCSLCAGIIKLILPLEDGKEVEKYWEWVYEEKTELPKGFMRNFRHSAAIIQKIYIDEKHHSEDGNGMSSLCSIS
jgi:hypothetical protein